MGFSTHNYMVHPRTTAADTTTPKAVQTSQHQHNAGRRNLIIFDTMTSDEMEHSFEEHESPQVYVPELSVYPVRKLETIKFRDHSSLPGPSDSIRFRYKAITSHVYPDSHGQFIIDEEYDDEGNRTLTTRRMDTETIGLIALRFVNTLVAVFFVSITCTGSTSTSTK